MGEIDASFGHYVAEIAVAQFVCYVRADAQNDYRVMEVATFKQR